MKVEVTSNAEEVMKSLLARTQAYRQNLRAQMFRALTLLEAEILMNIRSKSGLKVRTGALLNSIGATKKVVDDGHNISGEIGSEGVPYAQIHEHGGTTKAHKIYPRNAQALAFRFGGKNVFAAFVNHPGSKIPARPFLRPALAAKQDEIMKNFGLFIEAAFKRE